MIVHEPIVILLHSNKITHTHMYFQTMEVRDLDTLTTLTIFLTHKKFYHIFDTYSYSYILLCDYYLLNFDMFNYLY